MSRELIEWVRCYREQHPSDEWPESRKAAAFHLTVELLEDDANAFQVEQAVYDFRASRRSRVLVEKRRLRGRLTFHVYLEDLKEALFFKMRFM